MPLVIMCGFPSSGKSSRSEELREYLANTENRDVEVVREDIGFQKNYVYLESTREKDVRASLKSVVERKLRRDNVVILDSLNYIKGFRYELYCTSKTDKTTHCLIHCSTSQETCIRWNNARPEAEKYDHDILEALIMRFEEPNPKTRWDSPLFVVREDATTPCEQVSASLFGRQAPEPNKSTIPQPLSPANFLFDLDKATKDIVSSIVESQKFAGPGDSIAISGATEKLRLSRKLTMMELHRYRRQFINYSKTHPLTDTQRLPNVFVQYLQGIVT